MASQWIDARSLKLHADGGFMNAFLNWWSRLGLRFKLQILIQGFLIVVLAGAQAWISSVFERQVRESAEVRARTIADGAINGLNTMMVTQVGDAPMVMDKSARKLFIDKMGTADKVREVRVVRGKAVSDLYQEGLPQEQAVDDLDRRVLETGKPQVQTVLDGGHEAALRVVLPFIAKSEFRGTNCLGCHAVDEGAVLGAASVTIDTREDLAALERTHAWLWVGQLVVQVLCGFALFLVARSVVRRLGGEPEEAADVARQVAHGDLSLQVNVAGDDSHSLMAKLRHMQRSLKDIVLDVRRNAENVASASAEIAQGNQDLSDRTEQQASALQETASSMEQLNATVKQNADNARQASELAMNASAVAVRGGEVVGQVVESMKDIHDKSRRISDIISIIDGIAFQTNILALNAAVEAARAGELGRGFAVVASEVRTLAQRSAEASKQIAGLINASVSRVEQGAALVDEAGATMQEVVDSIRRVNDIVAEISTASSEQSAGVAQVGDAILQMDQTTQQNAALVEQGAAAAQNLRERAEQLVRAVSVFRLSDAEAQTEPG
jgi:methyl-accepting chemotaxis protein